MASDQHTNGDVRGRPTLCTRTPELVGTLAGPVLRGAAVWRVGASGRDAGAGAGGFVVVAVGTF